MQYWRESKDADATDRISNIRDLITNVVANYDTLAEFLEHAALMTTDDNDNEINATAAAVNIMTIHAAKGLEFDTVFLPAWEEGVFPNDKVIKEGGLEEERRLAYVALTRARRRVIITNTMSRVIFGAKQYYPPARFISELSERYISFNGCMPQYGVSQYTKLHSKKKIENIVGKLVEHDELGRGVVIESHDDILTVAFNRTGIKKVKCDFVKFIE